MDLFDSWTSSLFSGSLQLVDCSIPSTFSTISTISGSLTCWYDSLAVTFSMVLTGLGTVIGSCVGFCWSDCLTYLYFASFSFIDSTFGLTVSMWIVLDSVLLSLSTYANFDSFSHINFLLVYFLSLLDWLDSVSCVGCLLGSFT